MMPKACAHDQIRLTVWQLVTHWCPPGMKLNPVRDAARRAIGGTAFMAFFCSMWFGAALSRLMIESGSTHTPDDAFSVALMISGAITFVASCIRVWLFARYDCYSRFWVLDNTEKADGAPKQAPAFDAGAAVDLSKDADGLGRAAQRLLDVKAKWTERGSAALGIVRQGRTLQALEIAFDECRALQTSPVLQGDFSARGQLAGHLHEVCDFVDGSLGAIGQKEIDGLDARLTANRRLLQSVPRDPA
jgi:hypothetical protein